MRILLVMDSLFTGGAEYSTLLWMEWMQQQAYEVKLVLLKQKHPAYQVTQFRIKPESVSTLRGKNATERYKELKKEIQSFRPDVVHSVLTSAGFLCRILRIATGGFQHIESLVNQPYSKERLQDRNLKPWKIRLLQAFDRVTQGRGVDVFHANSEAVALHYCREVGVPSNKLTVIPRGREENSFVKERSEVRASLIKELQVQEPCLLLINTGRHEHQKGQDVLLKAVASLPPDLNWYLLIAGREGAVSATLHSLVEQYQLQERVRFLGHRTDVPRLLAASDLFVFPSRFEGMPGALIEACAAGLPVVCTDLPCMTEVVSTDAHARLFPAEDAVALSSQVEALLRNPHERATMGRSNLHLFQEKFRLESIHQRMESFYTLTLAGRK